MPSTARGPFLNSRTRSSASMLLLTGALPPQASGGAGSSSRRRTGGKSGERDACLRELGLTCRQPLQTKTGQEEDPRECAATTCSKQPELHRQSKCKHGDDERREGRCRQRPEATAEDRHREVSRAAKFVPQRSEKRDGRAIPVPRVPAGAGPSSAAIARCSAPVQERESARVAATSSNAPVVMLADGEAEPIGRECEQ